MSDQDDKTVPTAPDEANAAETSAAPEAVEATDGRPSALADALGEDPDATVSDVTETPSADDASRDEVVSRDDAAVEPTAEPVTEPAGDVPTAGDAPAELAPVPADEPAASPAPADQPSDDARSTDEPSAAPAPADEPAADAPAAKSEPDYAALAAELDELEARHSAARGAEPAETGADAGAGAAGAAGAGAAGAGAAGAASSPWFERADETQTFRATEPEPPAVTASEPVAPAPAPQPVFVEAPEPPSKRGNRGAAGLIGLLAAIVFALLTFAVRIGFDALAGEVSFENLADASLAIVTSLTFWIPVIAFFLGFWVIGALINNGRWVAWVLLGFVVGLIAYAGHVLAPVIAGPFWWLTQSEGLALIEENLLTPFSIAAFIIGREVTVWFGGWAAKRGARMTTLNEEAQAEYERTLEAGPAA